jgi:hypothetical protein
VAVIKRLAAGKSGMGSVMEPKITASEIRMPRIRFVITSLPSLSSLFRGDRVQERT